MKANYEKPKRDKELDGIAFKKCERGGYIMVGADLTSGKRSGSIWRKTK